MFSIFLVKILLRLALFCSSPQSTTSQQAYSWCVSSPEYACNGLHKTCHTYVTFQAQDPYTNASSIAALLGSDTTQIAQIDNIQISDDLVPDQLVIVPINCSCYGNYYQSNTTYFVDENYSLDYIATIIFESLTTCQAIQDRIGRASVFRGEKLVIPLRCACPTKNQTDVGIKYLITYPVQVNDTLFRISEKFDADLVETLQANFPDSDSEYSPLELYSTVLVPLHNPPNVSSIAPPPTSSPQPSPLFKQRYDPVILCVD